MPNPPPDAKSAADLEAARAVVVVAERARGDREQILPAPDHGRFLGRELRDVGRGDRPGRAIGNAIRRQKADGRRRIEDPADGEASGDSGERKRRASQPRKDDGSRRPLGAKNGIAASARTNAAHWPVTSQSWTRSGAGAG